MSRQRALSALDLRPTDRVPTWNCFPFSREFVEDVVACGADGLYFRNETDLRRIAAKFGGRLILIGNVSTQALTFGAETDVEAEVRRCIDAAGDCPGYFINVAGEIPPNVPPRNIRAFFTALERR